MTRTCPHCQGRGTLLLYGAGQGVSRMKWLWENWDSVKDLDLMDVVETLYQAGQYTKATTQKRDTKVSVRRYMELIRKWKQEEK